VLQARRRRPVRFVSSPDPFNARPQGAGFFIHGTSLFDQAPTNAQKKARHMALQLNASDLFRLAGAAVYRA
jgi:hypothetical protein